MVQLLSVVLHRHFNALVSHRSYLTCAWLLVIFLSLFTASDEKPSIAQLHLLRSPAGRRIWIIRRISHYYRDLGILLGLNNMMKFRYIDFWDINDPEDLCMDMFRYWLAGSGVRPCFWRMLIKLIEHLGEKQLAHEILEALSSWTCLFVFFFSFSFILYMLEWVRFIFSVLHKAQDGRTMTW